MKCRDNSWSCIWADHLCCKHLDLTFCKDSTWKNWKLPSNHKLGHTKICTYFKSYLISSIHSLICKDFSHKHMIGDHYILVLLKLYHLYFTFIAYLPLAQITIFVYRELNLFITPFRNLILRRALTYRILLSHRTCGLVHVNQNAL